LSEALAFEFPDFMTALIDNDSGRASLETLRESPIEHAGRFHKVVVHGDDRVAQFSRLWIR
jgi:hypothetical protein